MTGFRVVQYLYLCVYIPAGNASPSPPLGPGLGKVSDSQGNDYHYLVTIIVSIKKVIFFAIVKNISALLFLAVFREGYKEYFNKEFNEHTKNVKEGVPIPVINVGQVFESDHC